MSRHLTIDQIEQYRQGTVTPAALLEIDDHFGQKSRLVFSQVVSNAPLAADRFKFVPPKGVDVVQQ